MTIYNKIGLDYNQTRKADTRIFDSLYKYLEYPDNKTILDVGSGTGNYANLLAHKGNKIIAIEPSNEMINQHAENKNIRWINGYAEDMKLENSIGDCTICILSIHHFRNLKLSFKEIFRVLKSKGILLIYTYIPEEQDFFWLQEYFPTLFTIDIQKFPSRTRLKELLSDSGFDFSIIKKYELPSDLEDNFLAANWRKPENYLKEEIRRGISTFSLLAKEEIKQGINLLQRDLKTGEWYKKYGEILKKEYFDAGYRFMKFIKK